MMDLLDNNRYKEYRQKKLKWTRPQYILHEILLPCFIFGTLGAITWAIRGTSGWGGFDGALVPGFTWALVWFYFMYRRGIDASKIIFWLGLGIAIGGMWGYGQYVSWIQGTFFVNGAENTRSIAPAIGYLWFWFCGAAWGGVGGIFLGWALGKKASLKTWLKRIIIPVLFALLGYILTLLVPVLFFPFYEQGIYTDGSCTDCSRTYETNITTFIVIMWWVGALFTSVLEKDNGTCKYGLIMGGGFGIAFMISAIWTLGYVFAPQQTDWWKVWECFMGFYSGIILGYILYTVQTHFDSEIEQIEGSFMHLSNEISFKKIATLISFNFTILMAILIYGMSYMLGYQLGFYSFEEAGQYGFPIERILIVLIGAIMLFTWLIRRILLIYRFGGENSKEISIISLLSIKLAILGLIIGAVGFITIWPSNIWTLYLIFLGFFYIILYIIALTD